MAADQRAPLRVLVAGGGVAAVEFMLAARALAGPRLELQIVAPGPELVYRPWMVAEPFGLATPRRFGLAEIAEEHGATLVRGTLDAVDPVGRRATTSEGRELTYEALVVATGAVGEQVIPGAAQFGGREEDIDSFASVLARAEAGRLSALALAVPDGVTWTLPLYELAFLTRTYLDLRQREDVVIALVTPEDEPLAVFGRRASKTVSSLLDEWRIETRNRSRPDSHYAGRLQITPGPPVVADEVVALPRLRGPALAGLPHDEEGFLPTDRHGRVRGLEGVYAAGDITAFPVKQGGIAAQQADAVADMVGMLAGAAVDPQPFQPTLRGLLVTGSTPTYLTKRLGDEQVDAAVVTGVPQWWPPTKIAGRYLGPYLATKAAAEPPERPFRRLEVDDLEPYLRPR